MNKQMIVYVAAIVAMLCIGVSCQAEPITLNRPARASNVHTNNPQWHPKHAVDGNPATRWATTDGTSQCWLEVDLGKERAFSCVRINEGWDRVRKFEIQIKKNDQWRTIHAGTKLGANYSARFQPATARYVRLNITESLDGPTIWEFQLYTSSPVRGKPTVDQIAWHELEVTMFVHYGPAAWQGREYDNHSTLLSKINPSKLDTDQWCRVAQSFGAKQIVFVAKHVGDFCWWRTDTTKYGIKETSYKNGKGDVLADMSKSCKKYGLKLGIYVYPGNHELGAGIGSGGRTKNPAKQEQANKIYRQQMTEVLSRYGEINEIWFDGSCKTPVKDIIDKFAPHAMIFQGPLTTIRWPGNEHGFSPYPAWQTVKKAYAVAGVATGRHSDPDGDVWLPMEMDTTLLNKAWFWKANWDHRIKSVDQLMDIYYKSVGRGGVLLLNATPDTTGLIPASHVKRYKEFGEAIRRIYSNKKGDVAGTGRAIELRFDRSIAVNHIITMEDIRHGHIVLAYEVDGLIDGQWKKLHSGISIGYKQIDVIETVMVEGLRLRITQATNEPIIRSFAAYEAPTKGQITRDTKPAPWQQVAGFKSSKLTDQWQSINIDLTPYIRQPGQFEVELRKAGGNAKLTIKRAVVIMADTEAPRLITKLDRPHAWNINRTAAVTPDANGQTVLRIEARFVGQNAGTTQLFIRSTQ